MVMGNYRKCCFLRAAGHVLVFRVASVEDDNGFVVYGYAFRRFAERVAFLDSCWCAVEERVAWVFAPFSNISSEVVEHYVNVDWALVSGYSYRVHTISTDLSSVEEFFVSETTLWRWVEVAAVDRESQHGARWREFPIFTVVGDSATVRECIVCFIEVSFDETHDSGRAWLEGSLSFFFARSHSQQHSSNSECTQINVFHGTRW